MGWLIVWDDKVKEHIWKIDLVIVLASVFVLMGVVGYARPLVIAPFDEYESLDGDVLFSFERADVLLIDDNMDFTSPREYRVENGLILDLSSGVYYWKVKGLGFSEVRTLTINSRVELELVETADGFGVANVGNVGLNVDVYDGEKFIESRKIGVSGGVSGGDKYIGVQDE